MSGIPDAWLCREGGLYHLQTARDEAGLRHENHLGHAYSTDLVYWEERPPVLRVNPDRNDDI